MCWKCGIVGDATCELYHNRVENLEPLEEKKMFMDSKTIRKTKEQEEDLRGMQSS